MKYDAFISYRHAPLDMEIAKRIHTGLETFRVPASVRKQTGKKKIERVFRDQEELPIGADLNDKLFDALRESEFLIVICTPETPGSYWVCKEIETFITLHDRQHILAVLADGEPDESFPEPLTVDNVGNKVEPLAADVRGATPKERKKKLKTELLRLAAPVLGCSYDDLRQRHRERILKRNLLAGTIAAAVVGVAGAVFGSYSTIVANKMTELSEQNYRYYKEQEELAAKMSDLVDQKSELLQEKSALLDDKSALLEEVEAEYLRKQENQSRFYAEEALKQFEAGNREDAVLIAAAALPTDENERPYVAEAEYALSTALRAYDYGKKLGADRIISHDLSVSRMVLDRYADHLTSIDAGDSVYSWDCKTWELLLKISPYITEDNSYANVVTAFSDDSGVIVVYDKEIVRYDYTGKEIGRCDKDLPRIKDCKFQDKNDTLYCVTNEKVYLLGISDLKVKAEIKNRSDESFSSEYAVDDEGKYFAIGHSDSIGDSNLISLIDLKKNSVKDLEVSEEYVLTMTMTQNGNLAVISTNGDFFYTKPDIVMLDVFSMKDGKKLHGEQLSIDIRDAVSFTTFIDSRSYNDRNEILVVADSDLVVVDEKTGREFCNITLSGKAVSLWPNLDNSIAYIGCYNGDILCVNTEEGFLYVDSTIKTGGEMSDMELLQNGVAIQRPKVGEIAIMSYHIADGLAALPTLTDDCYGEAVAPSSKYYILDSLVSAYAPIRFFDPNGTLIYSFDEEQISTNVRGFYGDVYVAAATDMVYLIDPFSESYKKLVYKDLGISSGYSRYRLSSNGEYLLLWGAGGIAVISLKDEKVIHHDQEIEKVMSVMITPDGKKLLISKNGTNLMIRDLESGETRTAEDQSLRQVTDSDRLASLKCDSQGKLLAMACDDGYIRVIYLDTLQTVQTIPLRVRLGYFFDFTADSEHLIIQGDEYRIRVYDIRTASCLCSFAAPNRIYYMVEGNGKIALCDNYNVNLIDAETFGHLAYVPRAVTYLTESDKFILVHYDEVYSVPYKDYKVLLQEVEKQFPGRSLSDEKKVTYNVD